MIRSFHGTSSRYLDSILKDGIQPRVLTKNSNYRGDIISRPDMVYLSRGFPVYYAQFPLRNNDDIVVLDVEVDPSKCYPDEDFLGIMFSRTIKGDLHKVTSMMDPTEFPHLLDRCLEFTGSCCHFSTILPSQIKSYRVIPTELLYVLGGDANPMVGAFYGLKIWQWYERKLKYLFENGVEALKEQLKIEGDKLLKGEFTDINFL